VNPYFSLNQHRAIPAIRPLPLPAPAPLAASRRGSLKSVNLKKTKR
jgi:hypothetical protein